MDAMQVEGVIFDMDGTLLDSMACWENVGANYLRSCGVEPPVGLRAIIKPMSLLQTARYFQQTYDLQADLEVIAAGINQQAEHMYFELVQPKPGALAILQSLRLQDVPMCVATATDAYLAEAVLKRCEFLQYFAHILTCTDVGAGKAESPAVYEAALQRLGTAKAATPVFEDAFHALSMAKQAGFPVVGVYDAANSGQQAAIRRLSDFYVRSLLELSLGTDRCLTFSTKAQ